MMTKCSKYTQNKQQNHCLRTDSSRCRQMGAGGCAVIYYWPDICPLLPKITGKQSNAITISPVVPAFSEIQNLELPELYLEIAYIICKYWLLKTV